MVEIDSCRLIWGALFQYGMQKKKKEKLRHVVLYYHHRDVREMCDANILGYYGIDGKSNCSYIISKHSSYTQVWYKLKPKSFYSRNIGNPIVNAEESNEDT